MTRQAWPHVQITKVNRGDFVSECLHAEWLRISESGLQKLLGSLADTASLVTQVDAKFIICFVDGWLVSVPFQTVTVSLWIHPLLPPMLWQYCIDQHAASERILLEKSQATIKVKLDAHWFAEPVKMSLTQVQPVTSNGASQKPCKTTEGIRVSCFFLLFRRASYY